MMHMRARDAEHPNNVPHDVLEFTEICDILLKEFKARLDVAMREQL